MNDCVTCKRYLESVESKRLLSCFKADYYIPGMIVYCRPQMIWVIESVLPLECGSWLPETNDSERGNRQLRAPYETCCQITGEVSVRLERTGKDGEILVWEIQHGFSDYEILSPRAKMALNYISGWRRRKDIYRKWCYDQRQKTDNSRLLSIESG